MSPLKMLMMATALTASAAAFAQSPDINRQIAVDPAPQAQQTPQAQDPVPTPVQVPVQTPNPTPTPVVLPVAVPIQVPIKTPTDPIAKAAFDMLDKHCARCHQDGKLGTRKTAAKGVANVLVLDEIARTPSLVIPGNPDASSLFTQISKGLMPYDTRQDMDLTKSDPTEAEITALRTWIQSLNVDQQAACSTRKTDTNTAAVDAMANDLKSLQPHRLKGTRYLTLTNLSNACSTAEEMKVYRAGAIKLLNSLSRSSDVVKLETIDASQSILRINIHDLGWSAQDWDAIVAVYPYAVKPDTPLYSFLAQMTTSDVPYVRADWFAFTASQPPLYDKLLGLAPDFFKFQKALGIDTERNIYEGKVKRAAFQNSGVSSNNRLIERHQISTGYFWTSYDFAGNRASQNLFEHPLGPTGANAFKHDGGETLFSLPNGFQGYYLNTADGKSLDKGPTSIVRDPSRLDQAVTNGISCFGCHDNGIKKARDEVRAVVGDDRRFSKAERQTIEALYPLAPEMDQVMEDDAKKFAAALTRAGIDPLLRLHGVEPINALARKYENKVDIALAAAEFGLSTKQFEQAAQRAGREAFAMMRRLAQGIMPRDQFELEFARLVPELTEDTLIDTKRYASYAGPVAKVEAPRKELARSFDISLYSDKSVYNQNDKPLFTVRSQENCFLTLINVDEKGMGTVIFPNKFQQDNQLVANRDFVFPPADSSFQFRLQDRGTETVVAVCTARPRAVDGITHNFSSTAFTPVGDYARSLTRQIVVEAAATHKPQPSTSTVVVKPEINARTAIKLTVR